jgi:hypothetical protein
MKLTRERLKQIIKEELEEMAHKPLPKDPLKRAARYGSIPQAIEDLRSSIDEEEADIIMDQVIQDFGLTPGSRQAEALKTALTAAAQVQKSRPRDAFRRTGGAEVWPPESDKE